MIRTCCALVAAICLPTSSYANENTKESREVLAAIDRFYDAFVAINLDQAAKTVDPNFSILEDTALSMGWAKYRENNLVPWMKDWKSFRTVNRKAVQLIIADKMAYAIMEFTMEIGKANGIERFAAAETVIVTKSEAGIWKVRHIHSSSHKI